MDRPRGVQSRHPAVYALLAKRAGAFVCDDCGVVQYAGKWRWGAPPRVEIQTGRCPACQRIRERYPAGTIRLPRAFLERREEILHMIHNVERARKAENPLERLMEVKESGGRLVITTTGTHIARQIAHRLARRFHQKARIRYAADESLIRVDWEESAERRPAKPSRSARRRGDRP
ncbi:MAG: ATPase [Planctomycetota bacterium]|nr:MAG: ATPase [Planctomycetota bacterium]